MIEVIPAIDLIDGKCVRLSQGDYDRCTDYGADPVDMAKMFLDNGLNRIHLVVLEGGGIKTGQALKDVFNAGTTYAIIGSVAARQPQLMQEWLKEYGGGKLILGADVRNGKVAVSGWMEDTSDTIDDLLNKFIPSGLTQAICTDISKDSKPEGPNEGMYTRLQSEFPTVVFTVSGGISSIHDIERLDSLGLQKVITGKALYENRISLPDLRRYVK